MDFTNLINFANNFDVNKKYGRKNDDAFLDRINHKYTVFTLIIFTILVSLSQYGGRPITCMYIENNVVKIA